MDFQESLFNHDRTNVRIVLDLQDLWFIVAHKSSYLRFGNSTVLILISWECTYERSSYRLLQTKASHSLIIANKVSFIILIGLSISSYQDLSSLGPESFTNYSTALLKKTIFDNIWQEQLICHTLSWNGWPLHPLFGVYCDL